MKQLKNLVFTLLIFTTLNTISQTPESDALVGTWLTTTGKARVKITKSGNYYYGRIIWLKEPNDPVTHKPKTDKHNPDVNAQNNPIIGLKILSGFEYTGNHTWEEGTIYDPENGKTYQCKISRNEANKLNIRGFIGFSMIGRTEVWNRVE
jgi:uncharacterized protein (DUF2147 family)